MRFKRFIARRGWESMPRFMQGMAEPAVMNTTTGLIPEPTRERRMHERSR